MYISVDVALQVLQMPVPVPFLSTDCRLARTMPPMDETLHNSSGSSDEELHCSGDVADQMDSDRGLPDGLAPRRNLHPESSRQLLYDWLEKNLDVSLYPSFHDAGARSMMVMLTTLTRSISDLCHKLEIPSLGDVTFQSPSHLINFTLQRSCDFCRLLQL